MLGTNRDRLLTTLAGSIIFGGAFTIIVLALIIKVGILIGIGYGILWLFGVV